METQNHSIENSVLIVDDSSIVCLAFERALNKAGYRVRTAKDGLEAIALLKDHPPHALLLDLKMPQMTGLELMRIVRERWPKTEIIIMTAFPDSAMIQETRKLGAMTLILKPIDDIIRLAHIVGQAVIRSRMRQNLPIDFESLWEQVLLEQGWITKPEFEKALTLAQEQKISLRSALLKAGIISDDELEFAIISFLEVPYVHLDPKMLDPNLLKSFPLSMARRLCCIPLGLENGEAHIVTSDPFNDSAREEIEALLEKPVVFSKGSKPEIMSMIEKLEQGNIATPTPADHSFHEADTGHHQSEEKNHAR